MRQSKGKRHVLWWGEWETGRQSSASGAGLDAGLAKAVLQRLPAQATGP